MCSFLAQQLLLCVCPWRELSAQQQEHARGSIQPLYTHQVLGVAGKCRALPFTPRTVGAAQKCLLQAWTVEGRNGWIWANMPWMSSNALSAGHFFYSSMMAFFNYSTCLLKNGSNHKSRSPKEGGIYAMSLLIGGKSSVESEIRNVDSHFYRTCRIFLYYSLWQEICFLKTTFNIAKYFSWLRECQKLDRFRNYSSTYHTGADQNPHKCGSCFLFRTAAVGKQQI